MNTCPGNSGWQSGTRSCIMPGLPTHLVQEINPRHSKKHYFVFRIIDDILDTDSYYTRADLLFLVDCTCTERASFTTGRR